MNKFTWKQYNQEEFRLNQKLNCAIIDARDAKNNFETFKRDNPSVVSPDPTFSDLYYDMVCMEAEVIYWRTKLAKFQANKASISD